MCADFPAKHKFNIIGALSGDTLMVWGFLDDHIYITGYVRVGGIKEWMQGEGVSQFPVLNLEDVELIGASLIASGVLQCAPASSQPGILQLLPTDMCWVHWLLLVGDFCNPSSVFINLSCLSDHQANGSTQKR